jgi:hypothetical protein
MAATRRSTRRWLGLAVVAAMAVYAGVAGQWWRTHRLPRRFEAVVPGQVYRSGVITPGQLRRLHRDYGIGRVISFLAPDSPLTIAERRTAEELGLQWENVPLPGDGASTPAERQRILALLTEPNAPATLVHCAAGVHRTGLAVGLYRLYCQHWSADGVLGELHAHGVRNGTHQNLCQALAAEAVAARKQQGARASGTSPLEEEER